MGAGWRCCRSTRSSPRDRAFTYHRKSLYPALFLVVLLLIIVETLALHLLIQRWSPGIAWLLTGLSLYSIFWIIGDFNDDVDAFRAELGRRHPAEHP